MGRGVGGGGEPGGRHPPQGPPTAQHEAGYVQDVDDEDENVGLSPLVAKTIAKRASEAALHLLLVPEVTGSEEESPEFQHSVSLAAALRNHIDAPYSCQGGVCSSCLGKVTEGKAVMTKNSILTDGEVADGFILTCQAHPVTPKITIDFDDV